MFKANVSLRSQPLTTYLILYHLYHIPRLSPLTNLLHAFLTALLNSHLLVHHQCPKLSTTVQTRSFKISYKMFSFSRSGQDPALPQAGKCPSVSHSHPSRGCVYRPRCLQETRAASPRYKPSRYPAPRRMNPPPRHLLPLPAVTPVPARTQR